MKPVVVGRNNIDGYLALYSTILLPNITTIDCSEASIQILLSAILISKGYSSQR